MLAFFTRAGNGTGMTEGGSWGLRKGVYPLARRWSQTKNSQKFDYEKITPSKAFDGARMDLHDGARIFMMEHASP
jgi:hypothetical protein